MTWTRFRQHQAARTTFYATYVHLESTKGHVSACQFVATAHEDTPFSPAWQLTAQPRLKGNGLLWCCGRFHPITQVPYRTLCCGRVWLEVRTEQCQGTSPMKEAPHAS